MRLLTFSSNILGNGPTNGISEDGALVGAELQSEAELSSDAAVLGRRLPAGAPEAAWPGAGVAELGVDGASALAMPPGSQVVANGGADHPEALDRALHAWLGVQAEDEELRADVALLLDDAAVLLEELLAARLLNSDQCWASLAASPTSSGTLGTSGVRPATGRAASCVGCPEGVGGALRGACPATSSVSDLGCLGKDLQ